MGEQTVTKVGTCEHWECFNFCEIFAHTQGLYAAFTWNQADGGRRFVNGTGKKQTLWQKERKAKR